MDDRQNAAANGLGRVFAGVSKGERLFGAEAKAGDEAAQDQQGHARGDGAENGEDAEQHQIELVDEAAAEAVGELTLTGGADEHAENGGRADEADFRSGCELRLQDERHERAEDREVDDVEKVSGGDQADDLLMQWRYLCFVQRFANEGFDALSHGVASLSPVFWFFGLQ